MTAILALVGESRMYIVAIAWLYVALMMAITEPSFIGGLLTLVFYGIAPCALVLWIFGAPQRRKNRSVAVAQRESDEPNGGDTATDKAELKQ
jgi:biotin transporter BioY